MTPEEAATPAAMIAHAMAHGASIEQLEKFYALQKVWEHDQAEKAFVAAMAEFKKAPPLIPHDKQNKQFNSTYASLANIVNKTNERLAEFGLNATWSVETTPDGWTKPDGSKLPLIAVTCTLQHERGFSKSVTQSAPADESGTKKDGSGASVKNPIQQIKSTITYLRGITFELVTGVVTGAKGINADDDGNGAGRGDDDNDPLAMYEGEDERNAIVEKLIAAAEKSEDLLCEEWAALDRRGRALVTDRTFGAMKKLARGGRS
jgi:hypothetical protein